MGWYGAKPTQALQRCPAFQLVQLPAAVSMLHWQSCSECLLVPRAELGCTTVATSAIAQG